MLHVRAVGYNVVFISTANRVLAGGSGTATQHKIQRKGGRVSKLYK
jgi:hypothetical protein